MSRRRGRYSRAKGKMPPSKFQQLSCKLRSSKTSHPQKKKILFKTNKQKRTRKFKETKPFDEKPVKTDDAEVPDTDGAPPASELTEYQNVEALKTTNEVTDSSENDPLGDGPLTIVVPEEIVDIDAEEKVEEKNSEVKAGIEVSIDENADTDHRSDKRSELNIDEENLKENNQSEESMSPEKTLEANDSTTKNICTVCNLVTDSSASLTQHMKQHSVTSNQTHQCLICSKSLSSASSLDRHMLVHSGERPFKCKLCDMSFTTNGNMHRHMRTHGEFELSDAAGSLDLRKRDGDSENESKSSDEKLYCPVCGKTFLCKYGLQSHMETHPNDPIICQKCKTISVNYSAHVEHTCNTQISDPAVNCYNSLTHSFHDLTFMDFSTSKFSLVSKSYCEKNIKHPNSAFHIFQCSECKKSFPCGRALKLHQKVHETEIGTFCPSCQCDFAASSFLQTHQLKHRAAEHCLHNTFQNEREEVHHNGKEDFLALLNLQTKESHLSLLKSINACNVKEDDFENIDYFVHGKVMKKLQQSENDGNNNSTSNNNDFADIQSIISLTSKAPLITAAQTSPIAGRPASPLPYLTRLPKSPEVAESAKISPETPSKEELVSMCSSVDMPDAQTPVLYSCNVCSQQFRNVGTLNRHCKLHIQRGSNYSCHLCSYVSVDKSTLIRHLRTHNGERPFQCVICKYAFTTKANCERHVRKRHKKFGKAEIRNAMQYNPNMSLRGAEQSSEVGSTETVCKYCGVDFKFNRVLRHHLRSLHNSCNRKPFSCKICKFGFSTKNNCIRHVLKQHPNLKDKLRSVVIPNSVMIQINNQEKNAQNMPQSDDSSSSCVNEEIQPLDLQQKVSESPLDLKSDKTTHANEAVIAAEGLVCLSETLPLQDEPLDLAAHPLDLTCKPLAAVTRKLDIRPFKIVNSALTTSATPLVIDLTVAKPPQPETQLQTETVTQEKIPKLDLSLESINRIDASGQKLRSFTCIYCKSGFTLKSNMERHIKRKHPEFARPTRSRNYIPSIVTPSLQKQCPATLSDKTRDALRHVLNNKVQQIPVFKTFNPETLPKFGTFKILGTSNLIAQPNNTALASTVNLSLDLSGKTKTVTIVDLNPKSVKLASNSDEHCSDLASVSSVICTANSPQFKQYLEKPAEIEKVSTSQTETKKVSNETTTKKSEMPSVSCPFCDRKFPWSSSLRRHILTHTGQKPFKCPKCALWFTTKSNCERHLIRKHGHKGDLITRSVPDRPYKCNHCLTSTFSTQGNLRKHFYLKHWTKSYLGMNCKPIQTGSVENAHAENNKTELSISQVTSQEHSYSQIEKYPFLCSFCNNSFEDFTGLCSHMSKHKNVIYSCYLCRKSFSSHETCFTHFKTSHSLVYMQINLKEKVNRGMKECVDIAEVSPENKSCPIACMICFEDMSSIEDLQKHFKVHLTEKKCCEQEIVLSQSCSPSPSRNTDTEELDGSSATNLKKLKVTKNKVKNSLLYLFTQNSTSNVKAIKAVNAKLDITTQEEESDLIQNLLGIHDSKMIDEMLVSADSAARLLGVKEV